MQIGLHESYETKLLHRFMKFVVLVEFSWRGHHPTIFKVRAKELLELGTQVLALCPQPKEVTDWISMHVPEAAARFHALEFFEAQKLPLPDPRLQSLAASVLALYRTAQIIRDPRRNPFGEPSLVMFSYLYGTKWVFPSLADWLLPYPWTCVLLQATRILHNWTKDSLWRRKSVVDRLTLLRTRHCCAVLTYNERIPSALSRALDGKPVFAIPDVTDLEKPDFDWPVAKEIKARARGRRIIGLFGNLCRDKGYLALLGAAQILDRERYFFVLAGTLVISPRDAEEWALWHGHPTLREENVLVHPKRMPQEAAYNALVSLSDVLFMAYRDFPESSNNMVKAAHFRKPIIVSAGHLMEFRTRLYRLGAVITEEDAIECAAAVEELTDPEWSRKTNPLFDEFANEQSEERSRAVLTEVLEMPKLK
jgi:glycosyltransferase involved in cell wall biosynthesis